MEFNGSYSQDNAIVNPLIVTSGDYQNSVGCFLSLNAEFDNTIIAFHETLIQRAINIRVLDFDKTPCECTIILNSEDYDPISETTDENGFLSVDYAIIGVLRILKEGRQTQEHDYDSDLLAGGVLQYTLKNSVPVVFADGHTLINEVPSNPQNDKFHLIE